ncbi:MAG: TIM44-like domain-containing protein [Gallionella sp.]
MKRFLMLLAIFLTSASLFATAADARRLGGGGSIGKQRTMAPQQAQKAPDAAPAQTPAAAPAPAGNKWMGPLAGLAIGAGLGALFASMGLGEGMGTILMILMGVMAAMFLFSLLRKKQPQPAMQYAGAGAPYNGPQPTQQRWADTALKTAPSVPTGKIPADFPVESFLRSAKTSFIRLQAANDRKDLNDIREYTTPEMFAEISMQMHERDDAPQKTDVIAINSELLEVAEEDGKAIASVRFTGQLRENNGTPENVDEVWHVQKDLHDDKSVWLLVGIQQTTLH